MALAGFAFSCMVVSSFSRAQQKVLDMGYPNDMNTSTMISGTYKIYLETFPINFLKPRTSTFFPYNYTTEFPTACLYFNQTQNSFELLTAELYCYWLKDDAILKSRHFKFSLTFLRTIICQCDGNFDLLHFFQPTKGDHSKIDAVISLVIKKCRGLIFPSQCHTLRQSAGRNLNGLSLINQVFHNGGNDSYIRQSQL